MASQVSEHDFWEEFRHRIGSRRYLTDVVGLVFALSSKLFAAPIPAGFSLDNENRRSRALDLWVCRYGTDWCLALFPGSKLSLFLHREFVEDLVAWRRISRSRLLPFHRPARVAEPRESTLKSSWKARWQQGRFILGRVRYHGAGLASYAWRVRGWKRLVRSQGSRRQVGSAQSAVGRSELLGRVPISDSLRNTSTASSPPLPDWVALPAADHRVSTGKEPAQ